MGHRYSYGDYTTKGHGVIDYGDGTGHSPSYSIGGGVPSNYKLFKTVNHVDGIASSIKNLSTNRKAEFIDMLKRRKSARINKTTAVKYKNGKIEVYKRPPKNKKASKSPEQQNNNFDEIYKHLKSVHKKAMKKNRGEQF